MQAKTNYTAVGVFVVVLTVAAFTIIIWLTTGLDSKPYKIYLAKVSESVSGLSIKAPVKYNGVPVGFVDKIKLDPNNPKHVLLFLNIENDVRIYQDTKAIIDSSGLTGISYVGLQGGNSSSSLLEKKPGEIYPVIEYQPSLLVHMDTTIKKLSQDLAGISVGIHRILSDENQQYFTSTLHNMEKTTEMLAQNSQHIENIIHHTDELLMHLAKVSATLPELIDNTNASVLAVGSMSNEVRIAGKEVRLTMRKSRETMNTVTNQILPVTEDALDNLSQMAEQVKQVGQALARNPSVIIRGRTPEAPGPGE